MNAPSLDKFEQAIIPNGKLFVNSSIIPRKTQRDVYKRQALGKALA